MVSAVGSISAMLLLPCVLLLAIRGRQLPRWERVLLMVLSGFSLALTACGTAAGLAQLRSSWARATAQSVATGVAARFCG